MKPAEDKVIVLNVGTYNSPIAMNVVWYRLKTKYASLAAGLTPLFRASESPENVKTGQHTLWLKMAGQDVNAAMERCKAIAAQSISCTVEMIPARPAKAADALVGAKAEKG